MNAPLSYRVYQRHGEGKWMLIKKVQDLRRKAVAVMIKKFKCTREFSIPEYDDDGFPTEKKILIEEGEIFECDTENQVRMVGNPNETLHLTNGYRWIEITIESVGKLFEEVKGDE